MAEEFDHFDRVEVVTGAGSRDAPPILGSEDGTVRRADEMSALPVEGARTRSIEGHGHVRTEIDEPQDSPPVPAKEQEGESVGFPVGVHGQDLSDRGQAGRGQDGDQNGASGRRHRTQNG